MGEAFNRKSSINGQTQAHPASSSSHVTIFRSNDQPSSSCKAGGRYRMLSFHSGTRSVSSAVHRAHVSKSKIDSVSNRGAFFRTNLCEVSCVCIHRPENQSVRKLSGHKRVILWLKPDPWTGGNRKRPTFSHDAETANDKRSCGDWDSDFLFLLTFVCASLGGKFFFHSNGTP